MPAPPRMSRFSRHRLAGAAAPLHGSQPQRPAPPARPRAGRASQAVQPPGGVAGKVDRLTASILYTPAAMPPQLALMPHLPAYQQPLPSSLSATDLTAAMWPGALPGYQAQLQRALLLQARPRSLHLAGVRARAAPACLQLPEARRAAGCPCMALTATGHGAGKPRGRPAKHAKRFRQQPGRLCKPPSTHRACARLGLTGAPSPAERPLASGRPACPRAPGRGLLPELSPHPQWLCCDVRSPARLVLSAPDVWEHRGGPLRCRQPRPATPEHEHMWTLTEHFTGPRWTHAALRCSSAPERIQPAPAPAW